MFEKKCSLNVKHDKIEKLTIIKETKKKTSGNGLRCSDVPHKSCCNYCLLWQV